MPDAVKIVAAVFLMVFAATVAVMVMGDLAGAVLHVPCGREVVDGAR